MLSNEIARLEMENITLRRALEELNIKMEQGSVLKPKSCQYCKHYIQHYIKGGEGGISEYTPINDGHCVCRVPLSKGRKRNPAPDDSCPYFEMGTYETRNIR